VSDAFRLPDAELASLDAAVTRALETGDQTALDVLGYGEVSCVLAVRSGERDLACKRLPPFHRGEDWRSYEACFAEYLASLEARGVRPVPSALQRTQRPDGTLSAWCVQPRLPASGLLSRSLHSASSEAAGQLFDRVLDAVLGSVSPELGLDAQLSNWILDGDELRYLDVTTPLLRGPEGRDRLPIAVFLASLPWALRPFVRRFLLRDILDKYFDPRGVLLDLLGNLVKERLERHLPSFAERASARLPVPITVEDARRYYSADARDWALLQRLRHADRWWQTRVRRKTYPFLLPGVIER
jgi:hypothetical protein